MWLWREAARTYTVLTVGDGLVTLIPSLLVSVAGGITLTRANSAGMLGGEIRQQLLARPATLYLASLVCGGDVPDSRACPSSPFFWSPQRSTGAGGDCPRILPRCPAPELVARREKESRSRAGLRSRRAAAA